MYAFLQAAKKEGIGATAEIFSLLQIPQGNECFQRMDLIFCEGPMDFSLDEFLNSQGIASSADEEDLDDGESGSKSI